MKRLLLAIVTAPAALYHRLRRRPRKIDLGYVKLTEERLDLIAKAERRNPWSGWKW